MVFVADSLAQDFRQFDGFIFDLDGTIYLGEKLIPGADRAVAAIRDAGKGVVFLSNKPLERRGAYAEKLTKLGIPASESDVVNSSYVMATYLRDERHGAVVYCIGEPPMIEELEAFGVQVIEDPTGRYSEIDVVVAAFDRTFDYQKLNHAMQAIKAGAGFVATNPDRTCPVDGGEIPDCAAMIGAIEGCTGKKVEVIVGKPNPLMLKAAAQRLGVDPSGCLMVGDRLDTDIQMGIDANMATAAVLTGVSSRADVEAFKSTHSGPSFILESVGAFVG